MSKRRELELYLHIPFCVKKCAYCDFLSAPADEEKKQEYVDTLVKEIEGYKHTYQNYYVTTIFVGGGTPSILTPVQMEGIFSALRKCFEIDREAEITIEVNPGTVTEKKADVWRNVGINRISIGLQSANDEELQMLGRIHTYRQFLDTYSLLREKGFTNMNVDLISAIPGQTVESWRKTLCAVAELQPEHISAYSLIIEEGTPFYEWYGESAKNQKVRLELPDEEIERLIYEDTEKLLQKYGYQRYEISNYAKKGYECKHNEGYWKRTEYLGIGLGASSLIGKQRFRNLSQYEEYTDAVWNQKELHEDYEKLEQADEIEEFMFLGLRMTEGISRKEFKECFGNELEKVYGQQLRNLKKDGLLVYENERVRLTKRGIDISNYVFEQFLL